MISYQMKKDIDLETKMENAITQKTVKSRSPIILVILCFCAIMCNGFATYKFVPIITSLMSYWHVGEGLIGTLQSSNSLASLAFLIPMGFLIRRWKPRWSGGLAAGMLVVGNLIGLFAQNFILLIVARLFEGLGAVSLNNVVHNIVQNHFDNDHRGKPLGIMNMGQYAGQFLNLLLAELLVAQFGWRVVYLYMSIFPMIFAIVWIIFANDSVTILGIKGGSAALKAAEERAAQGIVEEEHKEPGGLKVILKLFKNKHFILLCLATAMYNPAIIQFGSFIKTYLQVEKGMSSAQATGVYMVSTVCGAFAMLLAGILSDALKTRRKIAYTAFLITILLYFLLMKVPPGFVIIIMIFYGLIPKMMHVLSSSALPVVVENPRNIPVAMSIQGVLSAIVNLLGGILVGFLIQEAGYTVTIYVMMIFLFLGALFWFLNKKIK